MKVHVVAVLCAVLVGCSSSGGGGAASGPLVITALAPSYDSDSQAVDLALSFTNTSRVDLKYVQIEIAPYDAAGQRITSGEAGGLGILKLNGPYKPGEKVGPLVMQRVWFSSDIRCLEVVEVLASGLDYSTTVLNGADANAVVASDTRRVCGAHLQ